MNGRGEERERKGSRAGRWLACAGAVALAATAAMGGALWALHEAGPRAAWLLRACTSGPFLVYAGLLAACGSAFAAVAAALYQAGRPYRRRHGGQDGVAIIEFALAMPFLLALALLMAQTSLLMAGNLCVHYAAFCAARTATVTVPKDFGPNEPRNCLKDNGDASGKLHRIKMAAAWAVMPVSCGSDEIATSGDTIPDGLNQFFGVQNETAPTWVDERLSRKFTYAMDHTEVAVRPPEVDKDDDDDLYDEHEDIHVTVRHTLYLAVPYAARIFAMFPGGVRLDFGEGEFGTAVTASCVLPSEGVQDYVDIETFPQDRN